MEPIKLWWAFENELVKDIGAIPPSSLDLMESKLCAHSPFRSKDRDNIQNIIKETNYKVKPSDCGPYRLISSYGFVSYAPIDFTIECNENHDAIINSAKWPYSENGFVAVPIAGSDYIKINTGIMVFFPKHYYLYQGPIPNAINTHPRVMAGLEYTKTDKTYDIENTLCGLANINIVIEKPSAGSLLKITKGKSLGWFFPLPKRNELSLNYIGDK